MIGGKVFFYVSGTSTPKNTFKERSQSTLNSNPVILDSNGEADIWFEVGYYKVVLKSSTDVLIWTVDGIAADAQGLNLDDLNAAVTAAQAAAETAWENAEAAAEEQVAKAEAAAAVAVSAVSGSVNTFFATTKTAADSLAASLADGATVIVDRDETRGGVEARYTVASGVLAFANDLDAGQVNTDSNDSVQSELNALSPVVPARTVTLAEVMSKTVTGGSLIINCYGDSMTYGQDTLSSTGDLQPGINGSSATRALYQYPEAMSAALTKAGFSVTVNNYGFPGDSSVQGKTRFPSAVACDIAFVMFGHNDANDVSGNPATSPQAFKDAMDFIIRREQSKGAFVILLTPPRLKQSNLSGVVVNRQRWMRVFESITNQLGEQFSIPVIAVDELVGHRGTEIYSDDVHFNKYGYNEWGWNLSAALIQRSSEPKRIAHGTIIHAAGSSITGSQTLLSGKTVLAATPSVPLCVSGYFEEDVIAQVYISYNTGIGGAQRAKITIGGGIRNNAVQQMRTVTATNAPGKILNSDVIKKGYRTLFLEVASTTTVVYIDRIEFVKPQRLFTDTSYEFVKVSALQGLSLPIASEINRWVIDDTMPLIGDFILEVDITTAPASGSSAGVSLVSEFNEADGNPNRFISLIRLGPNAAFSRVATGSNDDASYAGAFPSTPTLIKFVRTGDNVELYADGVLLATKAVTFKRLLPAIFRNNSEITVNRFVVK